jgi:hypothetical protein
MDDMENFMSKTIHHIFYIEFFQACKMWNITDYSSKLINTCKPFLYQATWYLASAFKLFHSIEVPFTSDLGVIF